MGTYDAGGDVPDLFGRISEVATDDAGNIYVADGQAQEIRVFDQHGAYIRTLGTRGEGPGEFQAITAMMVDSNGRLVVANAENARITTYNTDGTLLGTHASPIGHAVYQMSELPNRTFLLTGLHNEHLIHLVNHDLEETLTHLVPVSEVLYTEDHHEELWMQLAPGHVAPLSNNQILYASDVFGGQLHVYERQDQTTWSRTRTIDTYPLDDPLIISETAQDAALNVPLPTADGLFALRGFFLHATTRGLFPPSDGRVIHAFSLEQDDEISFLAGVIAPDRAYEGHFTVRAGDYEHHTDLRTFQVDTDDQLYLADNDEYPIVRRMRIVLDD